MIIDDYFTPIVEPIMEQLPISAYLFSVAIYPMSCGGTAHVGIKIPIEN